MNQHRDLAETLRRGVPDAPDLTGLAGRAEAAGRRARTRRRQAVGAGALAVVAVVASVTVAVRTGLDGAPPVVDELAGRAVSCQVDGQDDRTAAAPVSVRFCPVAEGPDAGPGGPALVPEVPLTEEVTKTLGRLSKAPGSLDCVSRRNPFRIQIGYADGSAIDLEPCDADYSALLEAIGRQEARDLPEPDPVRRHCPDRSALIGGPAGPFPTAGDLPDVRRLPAMTATRCEYRGLDLIIARGIEDPEELRATLLSTWNNAMVDCQPDPRGTVTAFIIRLADGSTHRAVVDDTMCGTTSLDGVPLGLAGPQIRELARRR